MGVTLPFLASYDPPGTSEGTLDPLGLYQIAGQLAVQLVPAVRERMQRIRFLTAMAVGAIVTEGREDDPQQRDASPYLVWEWLVVEALIRSMGEDSSVRGVPGTLVARRALDQRDYVDARSYLKTPRIFGFHGVYKRLATHLGLVDVHLGSGPNAERLVDAWARGMDLGGFDGAKPILSRWSSAIRRSLSEKPPRTKSGWGSEGWEELAQAFAPSACKAREKRYLRNLLHASDDRRLGALPTIWQLQADFKDEEFREELLHDRLEKREPGYQPLLAAIRAYESLARRLDARTYEATCRTCIWGCRMAVELIVDQWNSQVLGHRFETFCYGPKSCPAYRAAPTRKAPGRQGMRWEEEDGVDEEATAHCGADE